MHKIAELIAESNVVNFLIVLSILLVCYFKLIRSKVIGAHKDLIEEIKESDNLKEKSFETLKNAKEEFKNVDFEISEILNNAKDIIEKTEKQLNLELENIKARFSNQAKKIIENQVQNIKNKTRVEISEAALNKAETKLINMLSDSEVHHRFINQAIDEIDEAKI